MTLPAKIQSGDVIRLAANEAAGDLSLRRLSNVLIQGGRFSSIKIADCTDVVVTGYTLAPETVATEKTKAARIIGGSNVRLEHGRHIGPELDGVPMGRAISIEGGSDHAVTDAQFRGWFGCFTTSGGAQAVQLRRWRACDYRTTVINGVPGNDWLVSDIRAIAPRPINYGGAGDHGEALHFWTDAERGPVTGLVIEHLRMLQADGVATMGLYLDDNKENVGFEAPVLRDIVIASAHGQGLLLENCRDSELEEVVCKWTERGPRGADPRDTPLIHLTKNSTARLIDCEARVTVRNGGRVLA